MIRTMCASGMCTIEAVSTWRRLAPIAGARIDTSMQHTIDANILHEVVAAGEFCGEVGAWERLSDNRVVVGALRFDGLVDGKLEAASADQLAEADPRPTCLRDYRAIRHVEFKCWPFQPARAKGDQRVAGCRRRLANLHAADHDSSCCRRCLLDWA